MNQEEKKEAVLAWIQSGCNYQQGAMLYSQFGKNNFLKKDFLGKQHKHTTKIIYELCKSVGLDYAQLQRDKLINELPSTASRSGSIALINSPVPELVEGIPEVLEVYCLIVR